jgi:hypothetical protein
MAEETVDALVITTRFDDAGLDRAAQQQLAGLSRFHAAAEQIAKTSLGRQNAELERFVKEANDVLQLRGFNTEASVQELQELEAAFPPLQEALARIDPSGIFRRVAQDAGVATAALRTMAESAVAGQVAEQ